MTLLSFLTGCEAESKRIDPYPFRRTDFAWPYLVVCAILAAGEAVGFAASRASSCWPLALSLLVGVCLVGYGWSVRRWPHAALFLAGFVLALYCESRRARVFDWCDYTSSPLSHEFRVEANAKATKKYLSFDSTVDGVDVRVMIRRPEPPDASDPEPGRDDSPIPSVGETWRCSGWLERKARGERRRRRLWVCGRGCCAERVSKAHESSMSARLGRLREALSCNIGYGLFHDPFAADLDRAIVLGERTNLSQETRRMFVDAGTVHVFAISGLHVGIVAWIVVYLLMSVCCFPLRWVAVPLTPILVAYVLMIGAPPSAVRATVMSVAYFAAPMFFRRPDTLVAWSVTFVFFHVLNPAMLMTVGSQLSFAVMLGIVLYLRWTEAFGSNAPVSWGVSVAAWLSGVAIVARVFERITLGGLFANVAMIPLASFAVVFGFMGAVTGFVSPWLGAHFNNAAALTIEAMAGISWVTTRIPFANLVVRPWSWWMCVGWYVAVVLSFWLVRAVYLRRRRLI